MSNHRASGSYSTDIRIPNLDAMTRGELEAYSEAAWKRGDAAEGPARDWNFLAIQYAKLKSGAMGMRAAGEIAKALRYEERCENIYKQIPARMKW